MTTDQRTKLTPRDVMSRKGSFSQALYRAYCIADGDNRRRLDHAFPGLLRLDEPMDNPFAFNLWEREAE